MTQRNAMSGKVRETQFKMDQARATYEQKRSDVGVKLELLDENRIKVMRQQCLLLHSATGLFSSLISVLKNLQLRISTARSKKSRRRSRFLSDTNKIARRKSRASWSKITTEMVTKNHSFFINVHFDVTTYHCMYQTLTDLKCRGQRLAYVSLDKPTVSRGDSKLAWCFSIT